MTTGLIATLIAVLVMAFVDAIRRFYPSRQAWRRLRITRGRLAVRLMRERYEAAAEQRAFRWLAEVLAGLMIVWIAIASLLDKRWYEVVTDVLPYLFVGIALFRMPATLRAVADRMKEYERSVGEDPDEDWRESGEDGPTALAL